MQCKTLTPLCAVQGDDELFAFTFTLTKDDPTPLDLTGYTFRVTVGKTQETTESSDLMPDAAIIITDAVNGKANLALSDTDTSLPLGTYFYRVKWVSPAGKVKTIMKGTLSIEWAK